MPRRTRRLQTALTTLSALALATALAGCTAPATPPPSPTATTAAAAYPLTIDNCGTDITLTQAPERVVTIKSSTLELLLTLGLGDRVVGTAYSDGPVPEALAGAAADIPVLAEKLPSSEAMLATEPDFIYAGWESNLTAEGVGDRDVLAGLGVTGYVAPAACTEPGYAPNPLTFDDVFDGFAQIGDIFDVRADADALIATQREALDSITPDDRGLSAVWYSSGKDKPFVGAGTGAPELIMSTAGLKNGFADVQDSWTSTSWEAVAAIDPDVLVLVDAAWNTADEKIALLEANPVTAELKAVKNKAYIRVPFPATEAGVRTVDAAASIVKQLPQ